MRPAVAIARRINDGLSDLRFFQSPVPDQATTGFIVNDGHQRSPRNIQLGPFGARKRYAECLNWLAGRIVQQGDIDKGTGLPVGKTDLSVGGSYKVRPIGRGSTKRLVKDRRGSIASIESDHFDLD